MKGSEKARQSTKLWIGMMSLDFLIYHLLNLDRVKLKHFFKMMEGLIKKRTMKLAFLDSIMGT